MRGGGLAMELNSFIVWIKSLNKPRVEVDAGGSRPSYWTYCGIYCRTYYCWWDVLSGVVAALVCWLPWGTAYIFWCPIGGEACRKYHIER